MEPTSILSVSKKDLDDPNLSRLNNVIADLYRKIGAIQNNGKLTGLTQLDSAKMPVMNGTPDDNDVIPWGVAKRLLSPQAQRQAMIKNSWLGTSVRPITGIDIPANSSGSAQSIVDTHAARSTYPASNYDVGSFYYETDRNVLYQVQIPGGVKTWIWIAGEMYDIIANQPSDLGTEDEGFLFVSTDADLYVERWDGAAWVIVQYHSDVITSLAFSLLTGGSSGDVITNDGSDGFVWSAASGGTTNVYLSANASGSDSLTTSFVDTTGCSLSLNVDGYWLVIGTWLFVKATSDDECVGQLLLDGSAQTGFAGIAAPSADTITASATRVWVVQVTSQPKVAKLQAKKNSGAGASQSVINSTNITAVFLRT